MSDYDFEDKNFDFDVDVFALEFVRSVSREVYDNKQAFLTEIKERVAVKLVEKGIDLIVVKEILGHSKIDTTMRYAHAVPKRKLDAIEVLNSYAA